MEKMSGQEFVQMIVDFIKTIIAAIRSIIGAAKGTEPEETTAAAEYEVEG